MSKRKQEETLIDIVDAKGRFENYFEKNQTLVLGVLVGIVLLVGGYLAYKNIYQAPRVKEAAEQMFQAQFQFDRDSFALALSNPGGGYDGFLGIIDNYGATPSANLANYYSGICYLQLGQFEDALDYLGDFKTWGEYNAHYEVWSYGRCPFGVE